MIKLASISIKYITSEINLWTSGLESYIELDLYIINNFTDLWMLTHNAKRNIETFIGICILFDMISSSTKTCTTRTWLHQKIVVSYVSHPQTYLLVCSFRPSIKLNKKNIDFHVSSTNKKLRWQNSKSIKYL